MVYTKYKCEFCSITNMCTESYIFQYPNVVCRIIECVRHFFQVFLRFSFLEEGKTLAIKFLLQNFRPTEISSARVRTAKYYGLIIAFVGNSWIEGTKIRLGAFKCAKFYEWQIIRKKYGYEKTARIILYFFWRWIQYTDYLNNYFTSYIRKTEKNIHQRDNIQFKLEYDFSYQWITKRCPDDKMKHIRYIIIIRLVIYNYVPYLNFKFSLYN